MGGNNKNKHLTGSLCCLHQFMYHMICWCKGKKLMKIIILLTRGNMERSSTWSGFKSVICDGRWIHRTLTWDGRRIHRALVHDGRLIHRALSWDGRWIHRALTCDRRRFTAVMWDGKRIHSSMWWEKDSQQLCVLGEGFTPRMWWEKASQLWWEKASQLWWEKDSQLWWEKDSQLWCVLGEGFTAVMGEGFTAVMCAGRRIHRSDGGRIHRALMCDNNNNNGYLAHRPAQALSAYIFFTCTCCQNWMYTIQMLPPPPTHTHVHRAACQGNGTEEKVFKKKKVFKKDL